MTAAMTAPDLHVPDEPTVHAQAWLAEVLDGRELETVLTADGGVAGWLWTRWRTLATVGLSEADLNAIVVDYRRELWLWLAGERTWVQTCSGLIGRIERRLPHAPTAG
jgi:hypothetical protein